MREKREAWEYLETLAHLVHRAALELLDPMAPLE